MKKYIPFILFFFFAYANKIEAQQPISKGKTQLNLGIGLSNWGMPLYVGVDYGLNKNFTLGGEISFRSFNENWKGNDYGQNIVGFLGNINYHFNTVFDIPSKFDFYAGLNIGFYAWSSPANYGGDNISGLGLGAQVGGRYYLSKKVALNLEIGGSNVFSDGKLGVTFKL
jgi:hypothetical protein